MKKLKNELNDLKAKENKVQVDEDVRKVEMETESAMQIDTNNADVVSKVKVPSEGKATSKQPSK